jgi:hypothetical protein
VPGDGDRRADLPDVFGAARTSRTFSVDSRALEQIRGWKVD